MYTIDDYKKELTAAHAENEALRTQLADAHNRLASMAASMKYWKIEHAKARIAELLADPTKQFSLAAGEEINHNRRMIARWTQELKEQEG